MRRLWVFGDSFSTPFNTFQQYCNFKGYTPKTYYEIIAETYGLEVKMCGKGGADNQTILETIINYLHEIDEKDVIIIGWTDWFRIRVVGDDGKWECLNPSHVNQPTINLSKYSINSIKDMIINRDHKNYIDELNNLIKLIKFTFKNNHIIDWCWVDESNQLNCVIKHIGRQKTIMEETNKTIWDFHWGEEGHKNLAEEFIRYIEKLNLIF